MNLRETAVLLDREAEEIVSRSGSDFIELGRIMDRISENDLWRLLEDPRTGSPYTSLESWVSVRCRSQRASAFAARKVYRALKETVPFTVMESAEPGTLKVLAELPESAQKNPEIQELAMNSTAGEFTQEVLERYPNELIERRVTWSLKPTMSQAAMYDRVLAKVQKAYAEVGSHLSREDAQEALYSDFESQQDAVSEASERPVEAIQ